MPKKYIVSILALLFALGTITASLPAAKAQDTVRFYVWDGVDNIIAGRTVGTTFAVEIWIDSPIAWRDTALGIVGYAISVRVDPAVLEVVGASKIAAMGGFLEAYLVEYGYDLEYTTGLLVGPVDKVTGTVLDVSEYILGYKTLGLGAGGGPYKLMRFSFKSKSQTLPSPIDIFGRDVLSINAIYTTPDGVDHFVDLMDDGYYVAQITDEIMVDLDGTVDPMAPLNSKWFQIWPHSDNPFLTLSTWIDSNLDGSLGLTDDIEMTNDGTGVKTWWDVITVALPFADDGETDMTLKSIPPPVPEFPLGIGVLMSLVALIPVVYVWRTRPQKKVLQK